MTQLGFPILSLITFLPLVGVFLLVTLQGEDELIACRARMIALVTSLVVLALGLYLWDVFDPSIPGYQFNEMLPWLSGFGISYRMGVDGISLFLILLTLFLTPIAIMASGSITRRVRGFFSALLLLETMTVGMFAATDLVLFYIFFEAVLLPMYLIIGVWGGERRIYAAVKFFIFTLAGSLFMLLALIWMWHNAGSTNITTLLHTPIPPKVQMWLFLAFLASFGVKAAVWPLHTWLPDAYGEAPLPGTIMLAAVLSKMGAYGFLRFAVPMLPNAAAAAAPLMFVLGVVAVVYVSFVALAQTDMKRMIAYSSVAHMGIIIIGIFTFTVEGVEGALLMLFSLANVGLPGTSGFIGEILVIVGALKVNFWVALFAATGMVLSVAYMLVLVRAALFDKFTRPQLAGLLDLNGKEYAMMLPLAALVLWLGIYPSSFTHVFAAPVAALIQAHTASLMPHTALAMVTK